MSIDISLFDIFSLCRAVNFYIEHICRSSLCCVALSKSLFADDEAAAMDVEGERADDKDRARNTGETAQVDFGFLPKSLISQCQALIESFHDIHGYPCLPDILWKAGLGPFIETHWQFRQLLRKASTSRSAKKSNEGFVKIATTILSLEILASRFAGWSSIYPREASRSRAILKANARGPHTPLIEFYLYPPKYLNSAAVAALVPPRNAHDADIYSVPTEETARNQTAIGYLEAM
jgi:hypothetical protein